MGTRTVALAATLTACAALCATGWGNSGAGVRTCAQRAESNDPFSIAGHDIIARRLVFFTLDAGASPVTRQQPEGDGYWLKVLVAVRTGPPVTLIVPKHDRGRYALVYRGVARNGASAPISVRRGDATVRIEPCAPTVHRFSGRGRVGNWTLFPGGFAFRGPGCYTLDIRVGRRVLHRALPYDTTAPCTAGRASRVAAARPRS